MAKKRYRKPGNLHDVQCILWTLIREVEDRVFDAHGDRLSLDDLLRISHALAQLTGSYLKVCEGAELEAQIRELEMTVNALMTSRNGHGHPHPTA